MKNALKAVLGLVALEVALIALDHGSSQHKHLPALLLAAVYVAGIALAAAARARRRQRQPQRQSGWQR